MNKASRLTVRPGVVTWRTTISGTMRYILGFIPTQLISVVSRRCESGLKLFMNEKFLVKYDTWVNVLLSRQDLMKRSWSELMITTSCTDMLFVRCKVGEARLFWRLHLFLSNVDDFKSANDVAVLLWLFH